MTIGGVLNGVTLGGEQINQHSGERAIVLDDEETARAIS